MWNASLVAFLMLMAVVVGALVSFASTKYRAVASLRDSVEYERERVESDARDDESEIIEFERDGASTALDRDIRQRKLKSAMHAAKIEAAGAIRVADRALSVLDVDSHVGGELLRELRTYASVVRGDMSRIAGQVQQARALAAAQLAKAQKDAEENEQDAEDSEDDDDVVGDGGVGKEDELRQPITAAKDRVNELAMSDQLTSGTDKDHMRGSSTSLVMQKDGDLVFYDDRTQTRKWASGTSSKGTAPFRAIMQPDGNFVVYDAKNTATWATGTNTGAGTYKVTIGTKNFAIWKDGNIVWASDTVAPETSVDTQPTAPKSIAPPRKAALKGGLFALARRMVLLHKK
jgi:hypothetical protein